MFILGTKPLDETFCLALVNDTKIKNSTWEGQHCSDSTFRVCCTTTLTLLKLIWHINIIMYYMLYVMFVFHYVEFSDQRKFFFVYEL